MLVENPALGSHSVATAAAVGDLESLKLLAGQALEQPTGPLNAPPLVYAASSSVCNEGQLECALWLLAQGANPNATWQSLQFPGSPLSCLYGAVGLANNPAMAALLLDAGANPNDGESLYHSAEFRDHACLNLLIAHGAKFVRTNALLRMLDFEDIEGLRLCLAAGAEPDENNGNTIHHALIRGRGIDAIRLLLDHGASAQGAYKHALLLGETTIAELFPPQPLNGIELFLAACACADSAAAQQQKVILDTLTPFQLKLLPTQAERGRIHSVRLMLQLGWPVAVRGSWGGSALNHACYRGDAAMVQLLLQFGARWDEPNDFGGNALGAAQYASVNDPQPGAAYQAVFELLKANADSLLPTERAG